jgi:hypothetical protein
MIWLFLFESRGAQALLKIGHKKRPAQAGLFNVFVKITEQQQQNQQQQQQNQQELLQRQLLLQ